MLKKLLIAVICLTVVMGVITDVGLLCHSSCGTCPSFPRDINGCSTCSSSFLNYLSISVGEAPKTCSPDPNSAAHVNSELIYTIDGSCIIGDSHLWGYALGDTTVTQEQSLSTLGLYSSSNFVSSFTTLNPEVTFSLTNLGLNHYGIYFRVYAHCEGTSVESFYYKVNYVPYPSISIGYGQYQLIEPPTMINHTSYDLDLTFGFGFTGTCTSRDISEVSVYIMKCAQGCTACKTNAYTCLACEPDYIWNSVTKKCIPTKFCHSRCGTCSVKNDATKCTSCSSSLQTLSYLPFSNGQTEGSCSMTSTNNAQILTTVSKNTVLGSSILKSVTYNGVTESTSGNVLATFLYSNEVIEFKNLTNNVVNFGFETPTVHQKIIIRARVFTECSTENRTLTMTLSGGSSTPVKVTQPISSMTESIIEGEIVQNTDIFTVEFSFGSQSETCHKMIQDITIYYEKCLPYCGSNNCPDVMPYYKQLNELSCVNDCSPNYADVNGLQCVTDCPHGYTENNLNICVPFELCDSTCSTCANKMDSSQCSACSSTFISSLVYETFGVGVTESSCTFAPSNNAQYLMTINKNSVIGSNNLKSVKINSASQSTLGTSLSQIAYSQNVIEFMALTSNIVSFTLEALPPHQKVILRARVYTECTSSQNQSVSLMISGSPVTVTKTLTELSEDIIEAEAVHNALTFTFSIRFGTQGESCRRIVQDISVFYEKCQVHCGSNVCPDTLPHFKLEGQNECVNDCPNGYTESGTDCVMTAFCHSTCGDCLLKNDESQCSTCTSALALNYDTLVSPGTCTITSTNNAQYLLTVNKDTFIGSNQLVSVTYNSAAVEATPNTPLSSFLYTQNVIEFLTLTSNTVVFNFDNLPAQHQKIIVRARVFTECTTLQDQTIQLTLSGPTPAVVNSTLTPLLETVIEGEVLHSTSTFTLTVAFGTQSDTCRKIVQDISLYFEKCSSFCQSNVCPLSLPYFKHPVDAICVSDCPDGFTEVGDLCVETKFCHSTCRSCTVMNDATKCTSCSSTLGSFVYQSFGVAESSCAMTTTNNAQLLMTVNKDTPLGGTSHLRSVNYNSMTETLLTPLSAFLYTQNVIEVSLLTSNTISFVFDSLPIHQKLLVRARVFTECTTENTTVEMTLDGPSPYIVTQTLSTNSQTIIEGEVVHNTGPFTLVLQFGMQGETCRKQIQDISVYFEKCQAYCGSNDCPDTEPYFKHPVEAKCVSACPLGYIESSPNCVPTELCHSSCDTCLVKNDASSCSSCPSTISQLSYDPLAGPSGICSLTLTNNAQLLMTVNKNTLLRTNALKSITYNSVLHSTTGMALSSLLYSQNVIDFNSLSSNTVIFGFDFLPIHKKLIVRAKVFTECSASQNQSLSMTLSGDLPTVVTKSLTQSSEEVIEGEVVHSLPAFTLTFAFGTQGENCRKIIQDISVYYEKCLPYCQSNDCPSIEPYYKQLNVASCVNNCSPNFASPVDLMCVAVCPNGYTESGSSCAKVEMCHSTCGSCSVFNDPTKCTTCSSGLTSLSYTPFAAGVSASTCSPTPTNNAQYLMTVDKTTLIGSSLLSSVGYNSITQSTSGVSVGSLLYSENVIEFKGLTSNTITLDFVSLPIHQKLIVRVRARTECTASQNQTLQLTLASTTPEVITSTLTENVSTIIEGEVTHDTSTFTLTIEFGTQIETCRKMIHDISIYYEKCLPYCLSNSCPDTLPYYKHPSQSICLAQCPAGYIEAGQSCSPVDYCHSTCATCSLKLDPLQCSSCQSSYLSYATPLPTTGTEGACIIEPTDKWVPIMNIDKNTLLGVSLLKNVTYNTNTIVSTASATLGSFLYSQNTIEFSSLTNNIIRLEFSSLPTHYRLFARIQTYTECTITQNLIFIASLDGSSTIYTLTSSTEEVIETAPIDHNLPSLIMTIEFGTHGESCRKMVQDVSLFGQKCAAYCTSCIDGGSVKQFGSNDCKLNCPAGQYMTPDGTQCLQCQSPCTECSGTATNCTKCSMISGIQYFLNYTTPNDPLTGGVCVSRCLSNLYENRTTSICQLCDPMCLSCVNTASNCTQCAAFNGQNYFLQPANTGCLLTCPVGYYGNNQTFTCTLCDSRCSSCTGPTNSSCAACKTDSNNTPHYLAPNTTTCTNTCTDNRYYANSTTFKCEPCDSNCETCSFVATNCTTCKTTRDSQFIYLEGNKCVVACSANLLLYNSKCVATCPEATKESSVNNTLMCTICDGACSKPTFKMETVVINGGKELSHKVNFETGLHPSNTAQGIKESVKLWLVSQESRRLLQESDENDEEEFTGHRTRLLLRLQLSVDDLIISPDYQSITVRTPNPFSTSSLEQLISTRIEIEFLSPVNDANGVPYTQTVSDFSLEDKKFIESFYSQIGNDEYMAIGIVLCIFTTLAFVFSLYVYNRKVIHELLNFIMTIEIIGLIRMRAYAYPYIDLSWTLFGFSMFEFDWIPNSLTFLYPDGYTETIYANVSLTYDNQSLFTTWGSTLQVFVAMELALLIYYVVCKFKAIEPIKQVRERSKFIQHCILSLIMVKTIFSNILCLTSFSIMESTSKLSVVFWVAELFSILIFLAYFIYLIIHVRKSSKEVILERIKNTNISSSMTPEKPINFDEMTLNQTTTNLNSPVKVTPMKSSQQKFDLNHPEIVAEFMSETSENAQNQEELSGVKRCLANTKFEEIQMYKVFAFLKAIFVVVVISSKGFGGIILINIVEVAYFVIDMYFWRHERYNMKLFVVDEILTLVAYNTACFVQYDTKILHGLLIVAVYGILLIKTYYVVTAYILKRNLSAEENIKEDKEVAHENSIIHIAPVEKSKTSSIKEKSNKHQSVKNDISMENSLQEENLLDNKLITIGSEKEFRRTHTNNLKDIEYEEVFDYRNVETIDYAEVPTGERDERDAAKLKNKNAENPQDRDNRETAYGTFYNLKDSQQQNNITKKRLKVKQSNIFEEDNNPMGDESRSSRNELISINSHESMTEQQNLNQRKKRVKSKKDITNLEPPMINRNKSIGRGNEIRMVDHFVEDKEVEVIHVESKPAKVEEAKMIEEKQEEIPLPVFGEEKIETYQKIIVENKHETQKVPENAIEVVQNNLQNSIEDSNEQKIDHKVSNNNIPIEKIEASNKEVVLSQTEEKQHVQEITNEIPIIMATEFNKPLPVKHDDFKELLLMNFNSTPVTSQKQEETDHRPSTSYDDGKQRPKRSRKTEKSEMLLVWEEQENENLEEEVHRPATSYVSNEGDLLNLNKKSSTNKISVHTTILEDPEVNLEDKLDDSLQDYEELASFGENNDLEEKFIEAINIVKQEKAENQEAMIKNVDIQNSVPVIEEKKVWQNVDEKPVSIVTEEQVLNTINNEQNHNENLPSSIPAQLQQSLQQATTSTELTNLSQQQFTNQEEEPRLVYNEKEMNEN